MLGTHYCCETAAAPAHTAPKPLLQAFMDSEDRGPFGQSRQVPHRISPKVMLAARLPLALSPQRLPSGGAPL